VTKAYAKWVAQLEYALRVLAAVYDIASGDVTESATAAQVARTVQDMPSPQQAGRLLSDLAHDGMLEKFYETQDTARYRLTPTGRAAVLARRSEGDHVAVEPT
jgi:DNA-binding PadR family transcriptional regulator